MDKNLIWKIVLIAAVIFIAVINLYPPTQTLKPGIDLAGGTQLIYEIDTTGLTKAEQKDLAQRMIPILLKRIDPTHVANIVMRPQGDTRIEILLPVASKDTLAKRQAFEDELQKLEAENINLLKIRRALSQPAAKRGEILAGYARGDETRQQVLDTLVEAYDLRAAAQQQRDALDAKMAAVKEKLQQAGLDFDAVQYSLSVWAKETDLAKRTENIKKYLDGKLKDNAAAIAAATPLIGEYLQLTAQRSPIVDQLTDIDTGLNVRWDAAVSGLQKLNLNVDLVREILEMPAGTKRTEKLDAFKAAFPSRQDKINAVTAAYDEYKKVGGQLDDPEDLKRMLRGAGVLEFRILAVVDENTNAGELQSFVAALAEKGPKLASNNRFIWCEVEDADNWPKDMGVTGVFGEKLYVLCSNAKEDTLLNDPEKPWKLKKAEPGYDPQGRRAIDFTFDDVAATRFHNITTENIGKPLCILLDDKALSAPNIKSAIRSRGQITGNYNQQELTDMINKLNAGSFPARLSEVPISEKSISATIGADNRDAGIRAGLIGLAAVALFMIVYYMLSGMIAGVALALNILLVLGIMALLNATFTLPGIAGLILTIGMSVDANVLIFERIREEQNRGSSLKAAIMNGYQRAFRTIFDANLTTFGVAAILYMAASEEIKGFAIVLMLGIVSSMFTALFVTRVIYDLMTSSRMITNKLAMLAMMQNANINWMGKRPIFLTISAALMIGGLVIFAGRNSTGSEGKYDIEFVGGTTVEAEFKNDKSIDRQWVDETINKPEYLNGQARVVAIGETGLQYEISTTVTNKTTAAITPASGTTLTADALTRMIVDKADELGKTLSKLTVTAVGTGFEVSTSRVNATLVEDVLTQAVGDKAVVSDVEVHELVSDAVRNAFKDYLKVQEDLKLTFDSIEKIEPTSEDAALLADYLGGIRLTASLETPATAGELVKRITNVRFKPDMQDLTWYAYKLLKTDLTEPEQGEKLTRFVYVSVHPDAGYRTLSDDEWNAFVENEKDTVAGAASLETTLSRVTQIDPSIGGESKQRAIVAIILSLLAIIGYIWVRFGTARYGFAAIAALVHDVCITLGLVTACHFIAGTPLGNLLGVSDFKINLEMIAAFLTIIGYSLNDTIVVFDRIRENRGKLDILTPEMVNTSINQTLSRTLLTSFTTFLVVLIMYIWGGTGLRGFTFAMLVGIVVGTYSSIAIAAPILLLGSKKTTADKK